MIIAVTQKWSLRPACGEFLEITTQDSGKKVGGEDLPFFLNANYHAESAFPMNLQQRSVIARVVDLCGGCIPEVPHADLSKAAFTKLYDLDVGRVKGRE